MPAPIPPFSPRPSGLRIAAALATLAGFPAVAPAEAPVRISLNLAAPGPEIPARFAGLSYEAAQVLPGKDGGHYFRADNRPLIALFRTLGVGSLRIGGNSVDAAPAIPDETDIGELFRFAGAADVKVIYSVRLKDGDPQLAAKIARAIQDRYAARLECFAIGNEPDYYKPYAVYREKWKAIFDAMAAADPEARFCAPDQNPNPKLCRRMVEDFGGSGRLIMITEHSYPGGCAYSNPKAAVPDLIPNDPADAREKLLSDAWYGDYQKISQGAAQAVSGTAISFRIDETNSFWYGGLHGASDSYAAAIWTVDYLYWWASHGAAGINFHTGDRVGGGEHVLPCRYAAFVSAGGGYETRPLGYGLKMFDLGGHGTLIPAAVDGPPGSAVRAYATRSPDGAVTVTVIDKDHGPAAAPREVRIDCGERIGTDVRTISMSAPGGDVAATGGIALGGEPISANGAWRGKWSRLGRPASGREIRLRIAPASVTAVRFRVN